MHFGYPMFLASLMGGRGGSRRRGGMVVAALVASLLLAGCNRDGRSADVDAMDVARSADALLVDAGGGDLISPLAGSRICGSVLCHDGEACVESFPGGGPFDFSLPPGDFGLPRDLGIAPWQPSCAAVTLQCFDDTACFCRKVCPNASRCSRGQGNQGPDGRADYVCINR